ncbi:MAG: tetratricopeptide repeat protein [Agriterribacter sp.]
MRLFFTCILFFCATYATAQIDSLLALPDKDDRLRGFINWCTKNILWRGQINQHKKIALLEEAIAKIPKTGDLKIMREAKFFLALARIGGLMKDSDSYINHIQEILTSAEEAHNKDWYYTEVEFRMAASAIYFNGGKYREAFEQAEISHELINKIGLDKYPEANRFLAEIAVQYYQFNDYETAITYFRKAFSVAPQWFSFFRSFDYFNTFAYCFRRLEQYDSAIYYFEKSKQEAAKANNVFWTAFAGGNLGYLYADMGLYKKALPLVLRDFEVSKAYKQTGSAGMSAIALATIYIHEKDFEKATKYIQYSREYVDTTNLAGKTEVYLRLSLLHKAQKNYRLAFTYLDSANYFNNEHARKENAKIIGHIKLMNRVEKYHSALKKLESQREIANLLLGSIFGATVLVCIIALLVVNRIKSKKNNALNTTMLEKKLMADELEHARSKLHSFITVLKEKNILIENFKTSLQQLAHHNETQDESSVLSALEETTLLTAEGWKKFKELFDQVHPGFFIRLRERIPDVSATDLRIAALTKLKLSHKEMASILAVGDDAIRKARHRLSLKTHLGAETSLEQFVETI